MCYGERTWLLATRDRSATELPKSTCWSPGPSAVFTELCRVFPLPSALEGVRRSGDLEALRKLLGEWKPVSLPKFGGACALGDQADSSSRASCLKCNLNWRDLILDILSWSLWIYHNVRFLSCSSSLETDGQTPVWKLVEWNSSRKWLGNLQLSEAGCRVDEVIIILMKLVLAGVS